MSLQIKNEFDSDEVGEAFYELNNAYELIQNKKQKPYIIYPEVAELLKAVENLLSLPNPFVDEDKRISKETKKKDVVVDNYRLKSYGILLESLEKRMLRTKDKNECAQIKKQIDEINKRYKSVI